MKWIGQHIWDFISRFRSDVYLESVDSGTIASGGNLGLDSNNKIVKATTVGSATLASTVTVTDSTSSTNFPIVFHDESNSLLDDTGTFTYNPGAGMFEFSTSGVSAFFLNNSGINAVSGQMYLQNKRNGGAGSIDDNTGKIVFQGQNSNSETISFALQGNEDKLSNPLKMRDITAQYREFQGKPFRPKAMQEAQNVRQLPVLPAQPSTPPVQQSEIEPAEPASLFNRGTQALRDLELRKLLGID